MRRRSSNTGESTFEQIPDQSACALLQQIQHGEKEDPDQIDEVPVEPRVLDAVRELIRIGLPQLGAWSEEVQHDDHAAYDVEPVKPGHREVDRQERRMSRP